MSVQNILLYVERAFYFAVVVGAIWTGIYFFLYHKKRNNIPWFLCILVWVCYLSALVQITVIRDFTTFFTIDMDAYSLVSIQPIPLKTTIEAATLGLYSLVYHTIGNMVWFLPFGFLAPIVYPKISMKKVVCFAGLMSIGIEILQFVCQSGISDIDDTILNVFGAMVGYLVYVTIGHVVQSKRKIES